MKEEARRSDFQVRGSCGLGSLGCRTFSGFFFSLFAFFLCAMRGDEPIAKLECF